MKNFCDFCSIEFLNAIEWHHLAFVIISGSIVYFRKSLTDLFNRLKSVGFYKDRIKIDYSGDSQLKESPNLMTFKDHEKILNKSPTMNAILDIVQKDLESEKPTDNKNSIKILKIRLAEVKYYLFFERVHRVIFGSQIVLLQKLNVCGSLGLDIKTIKIFISDVLNKAEWQKSDYTLEKYLKFLLDSELIIKTDNDIKITIAGVEYLTWIAVEGISTDNRL